MRVLAITGNASLVVALGSMMRDWEVVTVRNVEEAVESGVDSIVALIDLGDSDRGLGVADELYRGGITIPAVVIGDRPVDHIRASVLVRPFSLEDLSVAVREAAQRVSVPEPEIQAPPAPPARVTPPRERSETPSAIARNGAVSAPRPAEQPEPKPRRPFSVVRPAPDPPAVEPELVAVEPETPPTEPVAPEPPAPADAEPPAAASVTQQTASAEHAPLALTDEGRARADETDAEPEVAVLEPEPAAEAPEPEVSTPEPDPEPEAEPEPGPVARPVQQYEERFTQERPVAPPPRTPVSMPAASAGQGAAAAAVAGPAVQAETASRWKLRRKPARPVGTQEAPEPPLARRLRAAVRQLREVEELLDELPVVEDLRALADALVGEMESQFSAPVMSVFARGEGGFHAIAHRGLSRVEAGMVVLETQPLFSDVLMTREGILIQPVDLAQGLVAGIGGARTEALMAAPAVVGGDCVAIVVIGGDRFNETDLDRLSDLAAEAAPGLAVAYALQRLRTRGSE